jgi:hypothetical protein
MPEHFGLNVLAGTGAAASVLVGSSAVEAGVGSVLTGLTSAVTGVSSFLLPLRAALSLALKLSSAARAKNLIVSLQECKWGVAEAGLAQPPGTDEEHTNARHSDCLVSIRG